MNRTDPVFLADIDLTERWGRVIDDDIVHLRWLLRRTPGADDAHAAVEDLFTQLQRHRVFQHRCVLPMLTAGRSLPTSLVEAWGVEALQLIACIEGVCSACDALGAYPVALARTCSFAASVQDHLLAEAQLLSSWTTTVACAQ